LSAQLIPLAGLISRIGRHSTATPGGKSFINQSDVECSAGASEIMQQSKIPPGYMGVSSIYRGTLFETD
jgi:hypothetical protein